MREDILQCIVERQQQRLFADSVVVKGGGDRELPVAELQHTGTTVFAVRFDDGILCASDRQVVRGFDSVSQSAEKIIQVSPRSALMGAGLMSSLQITAEALTRHNDLFIEDTGFVLSIEGQARWLALWQRSCPRSLFILDSILAGTNYENEMHIYQVMIDGLCRKSDDYDGVGSGYDHARNVLDDKWRPGMSCDQVLSLALEALYHAGYRDRGTSDLRIALPVVGLITEKGFRWLEPSEIAPACNRVLMGKRQVAMSLTDGSLQATTKPKPKPRPCKHRRAPRRRRRHV